MKNKAMELLYAIFTDWVLADRIDAQFQERMNLVFLPQFKAIQEEQTQQALGEPFPLNGEPKQLPI